jgi:MoaA/NifB/PqqE/SkfB family radical SAM enzyme
MKPGTELTVDDVAVVFRKIGPLDVVRLTGGEPFLREDLDAIAETIARESRPLVLHVTTNGSLPDRIEDFASRFSRPRALSFMVSLDGSPEVHDANRGEKATYALALESVRRLVAVRKRRRIDVSVNYTVISRQSVEDIESVRAEFASLGVDVHAVLAYAGSATYDLKLRGKRAERYIVPRGYPLHPALEGADVQGLVRREIANVSSLSSRIRRIGKRYYLRGLLARLQRETFSHAQPPCVALRSHVRVMPDGSVPVCQYNGETVGNLRLQGFDEVWRGMPAEKSRAWVDACPGCWAECEVMPSAIYSGDLFTSLAR